jgi:regulator of replication initiation timing
MLPQTIEDQVEELEGKVKALNEALSEEHMKNAQLKVALESIRGVLSKNGIEIDAALEPYLKL